MEGDKQKRFHCGGTTERRPKSCFSVSHPLQQLKIIADVAVKRLELIPASPSSVSIFMACLESNVWKHIIYLKNSTY